MADHPDIGPENQIPPAIPLTLDYDVLLDTEMIQKGFVRVKNNTINRHMHVVILAQIVDDKNLVLHEDTQFAYVAPLGNPEGGDTDGKIFQFDVSKLEEGQYSIVTFAWPKGFKDQRTSSIPHSFVIGNPF